MGGIHPPEPIAQSMWGQSGAARYRPIEPQPPRPAPCTPQWVGAAGSHGAPWGMKSSAPLWGTTASAPVPQPHTSHPTASGELSAHTWGPAGRVGGACRRCTHPRAPTPLCLHDARAQCRLCVGILQGPNPCQEPEATPGVGRRVLGVGVELRPTGAPRADTQHTLSTAAFPPLRLPAPHLEPHQECGQLTHAGGAAPAAPPALIDRGPHGCPTRGAEGCRHCVAPGGGGCQHCCCAPHPIPCVAALRAASGRPQLPYGCGATALLWGRRKEVLHRCRPRVVPALHGEHHPKDAPHLRGCAVPVSRLREPRLVGK